MVTSAVRKKQNTGGVSVPGQEGGRPRGGQRTEGGESREGRSETGD